jgi:hypothetical protein
LLGASFSISNIILLIRRGSTLMALKTYPRKFLYLVLYSDDVVIAVERLIALRLVLDIMDKGYDDHLDRVIYYVSLLHDNNRPEIVKHIAQRYGTLHELNTREDIIGPDGVKCKAIPLEVFVDSINKGFLSLANTLSISN